MKKSFVLYLDQYEVVKKLDKDQKAILFDNLFLYNLGHDVKIDDQLVDIVFTVFKTTFDRDKEKWLRKADANRENGKKGGRPKKNKNNDLGETHDNPENPDGYLKTHDNPEKPKKAVSGSVSVSGSVTLVKELLLHFNKKIKETELEEYEQKLLEFFEYRKIIKKPLKSKQGVTGFINIAKKLKDNNLDINKCFDYTMGKEWQSPPTDFFTKDKKEFKKEKESIDICLADSIWQNSTYQAGGLWKTSDIVFINWDSGMIDDDEREQVELNTSRFIAEYCEGGF